MVASSSAKSFGARDNLVALAAVGASTANQPALALYASLGFQPVDQATLYRLPGE